MPKRWEDEERRAGPWPALEQRQLAAAEALAATDPRVEAVYLFGSRARGQVHAGSDVDIAVLLEPPAPVSERVSRALKAGRFLEERLQTPVDVVALHPELSPALLFDIFRIETILYARDPERARRIARQARNEYRDLLPRLERRFARTKRRIEEIEPPGE